MNQANGYVPASSIRFSVSHFPFTTTSLSASVKPKFSVQNMWAWYMCFNIIYFRYLGICGTRTGACTLPVQVCLKIIGAKFTIVHCKLGTTNNFCSWVGSV